MNTYIKVAISALLVVLATGQRVVGRTIFDVVTSGNVEELQLILKVHPEETATLDKNGSTPLINAVKRNNKLMVKALLGGRADVNVADNYGNTPLIWAIMNDNVALVQMLLAAGADVNIATKNGWSPIMYAVMRPWASTRDSVKIVKLLLAAGADLDKKDKLGQRPLDLAISPQIRKLLLHHQQEFERQKKMAYRRQIKQQRAARKAFLAGQQPKAGARSPVRMLPPDVAHDVLNYLEPDDFPARKLEK